MRHLRLLRRHLLQREPLDLRSRQPHLPLAGGHWLLALVCAVGACRQPRQPAAGSTPAWEPSTAVTATAQREPARAPEPAAPAKAEATVQEPPSAEGFELVPLPVPGFLDAVVALPRAPTPRPLLVATH